MQSPRALLTLHAVLSVYVVSACGAAAPAMSRTEPPTASDDLAAARTAINTVLDDWHAAAAASDEERYFAHLTDDAVLLGTDATERWLPAAFRAYAHAPFAAQRGWNFRSIRRDVTVRYDVAWFDEDLDATNLGPCRGSGVLVRDASGRWKIAQYNLAITVPNERFDEVRSLLRAPATPPTE